MKPPSPLLMGTSNDRKGARWGTKRRSAGGLKGLEDSRSSLITGGLNDLAGRRGAMNRSEPSLELPSNVPTDPDESNRLSPPRTGPLVDLSGAAGATNRPPGPRDAPASEA